MTEYDVRAFAIPIYFFYFLFFQVGALPGMEERGGLQLPCTSPIFPMEGLKAILSNSCCSAGNKT